MSREIGFRTRSVIAALLPIMLVMTALPEAALADPGTYVLCNPSSFVIGTSTDIEWDYSQGHDTIITASGPSGTYTIDHQYYGPSSMNVFVWNGEASDGTQLAAGTYTVTVTPNDSDSRYAKSTSCTLEPSPPPPPPPPPSLTPVVIQPWSYAIGYDPAATLARWATWDVSFSLEALSSSTWNITGSPPGLSADSGGETLSVDAEGNIDTSVPTSTTSHLRAGVGQDPIPNVWIGTDQNTSLQGNDLSGTADVFAKEHYGVNPKGPELEAAALWASILVIIRSLAQWWKEDAPEMEGVVQEIIGFIEQLLKDPPPIPPMIAPPPGMVSVRPVDPGSASTGPLLGRLRLAATSSTSASNLIDENLGQGADQVFAPMQLNVPTTLNNGQAFGFDGSGYGSGDPVTIWSGPIGKLTLQTTVQADGSGQISGWLQLPQAATPGEWYVFALDYNQMTAYLNDLQAGQYNATVPMGVGSFNLIQDTAPPVVTLGVTPGSPTGGNGWYDTPVTISLSATDTQSGVAQMELSLDGGTSWTPYSGPITVTKDGVYSVEASAEDYAGNQDSTAPQTVRIDTTPPAVTASVTPSSPTGDGGWYDTPVTISMTATDNLSGIAETELSLDGGQTWTPYTGPVTVGKDGVYSIEASAVDDAGNQDKTTPQTVKVDTTPPAVTVGVTPSSPTGDGGWYDTPVTISLAATDNLSGVAETALSLDGGATWTPYSGPVTVTNCACDIEASAVDNAGNQGTSSVLTVKTDTIPPVTIASGIPVGWVNHAVQVALSATDNLSGVQGTYASLDGATPQEESQLGVLTEGYHVLTFWSQDVAGNVETIHSANIPIDLTPPVVTGTTSVSPNAKGWFHTDVTVTWTAFDPPLLDGHPGSGVQQVDPPTTITQEGKGTVVSGQAIDNAGNVGSGEVSLNIDKTPPVIAISQPTEGTYLDDQVLTPAFSATDNLSGVDTVQATVYGQAVTEGDTIQLWKLPLGQIPFTVTATDNAGNVTSQTVTFTMTTSLSSMEELIKEFASTGLIKNAGLANSLTEKLNAAQSAQAQGESQTTANILDAFTNEVQAQTSKGVDPVAAAVLLRDAQYVAHPGSD